MPFLTVNGLTLSVADGSAKESFEEIGDTSRAFDGTLRRSRLTRKRILSVDTAPMLATDAYAWEQLLAGEGHTWSFNTSLYSSKGLGPNASTGLTVNATAPQFGAGMMRVAAAGTPNTAVFATGLGSVWTVAVWVSVAAGPWGHFVVRSDGAKWVNGVRNDGAATAFLVVSGSVTLSGHTTDTVDYDDLVVLPYAVPDAWPETWGVATSAFSALPALTLGGDVVPEGTRTVMGSVEVSDVGQMTLGGSWRDNARVIAVTFSEV